MSRLSFFTPLALCMTHRALIRYKKVTDSSGEIVHPSSAKRLHHFAHLPERKEIVVDGDER